MTDRKRKNRRIGLTFHRDMYLVELFSTCSKPYMVFKLTQIEAESLYKLLDSRLRAKTHERTILD